MYPLAYSPLRCFEEFRTRTANGAAVCWLVSHTWTSSQRPGHLESMLH